MHRLHGFLKYVDQVDKTWVCVKMEDNKREKSAVQWLFNFDRYCILKLVACRCVSGHLVKSGGFKLKSRLQTAVIYSYQ